MRRRLTHAAIGAGIALSLFGWSAGRSGEVAGHAIVPATLAAIGAPLPHVSVQFSIEVRP